MSRRQRHRADFARRVRVCRRRQRMESGGRAEPSGGGRRRQRGASIWGRQRRWRVDFADRVPRRIERNGQRRSAGSSGAYRRASDRARSEAGRPAAGDVPRPPDGADAGAAGQRAGWRHQPHDVTDRGVPGREVCGRTALFFVFS